jgi:uncharacterized protein YegP (UPF0339 family)
VAARFEIRSPQAGKYTWVLTSQGRILATSEAYSRRSLAEEAIVSFRMAAVNAPVIDTTVPAKMTAPAKVARATGRALAKAVIKGNRAVERAAATATKPTAQR